MKNKQQINKIIKSFLKRVEDCPQTPLNEAQKASLSEIRKKAELCAEAENEALELRGGKGKRSGYKLKYHSMYPEVIVKIPHTFPNATMVIVYGEFLEKAARCMASDINNGSKCILDLVSTKEEKQVLTDWAQKISKNKSIYTDLFIDNEDELSEAELASLSEEASNRK